MIYCGHLFHRKTLAKRKPGMTRVSERNYEHTTRFDSQTPTPPIILFPSTDPGAFGRDIWRA